MYPDPKRILDIGEGSLSIMSKPSGGENLRDDLRYLKNSGFTHIISLLEAHEASELSLELESSICAELGISFNQCPVADRSIPKEPNVFIESVVCAYNAIDAGANLIAHCRAGIGRSGIYTASVLIYHGLSISDAFDLVSTARGISIPDTQIQIDWIHDNAHRLYHDA